MPTLGLVGGRSTLSGFLPPFPFLNPIDMGGTGELQRSVLQGWGSEAALSCCPQCSPTSAPVPPYPPPPPPLPHGLGHLRGPEGDLIHLCKANVSAQCLTQSGCPGSRELVENGKEKPSRFINMENLRDKKEPQLESPTNLRLEPGLIACCPCDLEQDI